MKARGAAGSLGSYSLTSTCWQIWMSLAIWFSSSLFLFTRLVRLFSRVCCQGRSEGTQLDGELNSAPSDSLLLSTVI